MLSSPATTSGAWPSTSARPQGSPTSSARTRRLRHRIRPHQRRHPRRLHRRRTRQRWAGHRARTAGRPVQLVAGTAKPATASTWPKRTLCAARSAKHSTPRRKPSASLLRKSGSTTSAAPSPATSFSSPGCGPGPNSANLPNASASSRDEPRRPDRISDPRDGKLPERGSHRQARLAVKTQSAKSCCCLLGRSTISRGRRSEMEPGRPFRRDAKEPIERLLRCRSGRAAQQRAGLP